MISWSETNRVASRLVVLICDTYSTTSVTATVPKYEPSTIAEAVSAPPKKRKAGKTVQCHGTCEKCGADCVAQKPLNTLRSKK